MALRKQDVDWLPTELGADYDATFRRLSAQFRRRGIGNEEAADLAQDVVTRTLVHLDRHGVTGAVGALMTTISKNLLVERRRRLRPDVVELTGAESVDDPSADPVELVASGERGRVVREALGRMNGRHRQALTMSMGGADVVEIANRMGVKRNAADAMLHRARRSLAEKLAPSREALLSWAGMLWPRVRLVAGALWMSHPFAVAGAMAGVATLGTIGVLALGPRMEVPDDSHSSITKRVEQVEPSAPAADEASQVAGEVSSEVASARSGKADREVLESGSVPDLTDVPIAPMTGGKLPDLRRLDPRSTVCETVDDSVAIVQPLALSLPLCMP